MTLFVLAIVISAATAAYVFYKYRLRVSFLISNDKTNSLQMPPELFDSHTVLSSLFVVLHGFRDHVDHVAVHAPRQPPEWGTTLERRYNNMMRV